MVERERIKQLLVKTERGGKERIMKMELQKRKTRGKRRV